MKTLWTSFREVIPDPASMPADPTIRKWAIRRAEAQRFYQNSRYMVCLEVVREGVIVLSIRRLDRNAIHDWRDLQRIKNEIVGPEHVAIEFYPPESRLVDTANQFWLFVFQEVPELLDELLFPARAVSEITFDGRSRQRPCAKEDRPADLETQELHDARIAALKASFSKE